METSSCRRTTEREAAFPRREVAVVRPLIEFDESDLDAFFPEGEGRARAERIGGNVLAAMAHGGIDSGELIRAVNDLSKERRVNKDVLFSAIEAALISAYKKNYGKSANVRASIDRDRGEIEVLSRKTVVEEVTDPQCEMTLAGGPRDRPPLRGGRPGGSARHARATLAASRRRPPSRWSCSICARPSAA